jgi:excisionase family DNA binding protein
MSEEASPQSDLIVHEHEERDGRLLDKIDEAAHKLNVCQRQVYRLVEAGVLESVKLGRAHRITRSSIRRAANGDTK